LIEIGDKGVQVTVAVHVAQRDVVAGGTAQRLTAVDKRAAAAGDSRAKLPDVRLDRQQSGVLDACRRGHLDQLSRMKIGGRV